MYNCDVCGESSQPGQMCLKRVVLRDKMYNHGFHTNKQGVYELKQSHGTEIAREIRLCLTHYAEAK